MHHVAGALLAERVFVWGRPTLSKSLTVKKTPPNLHFLSTPPSPAPATAPRARAPAETSRCASLVCVYQKPIQDRRIHARASGHKNTSTFFYLVGLRGSRARASRLATTAPPPPHHMRAQSQQGGVEGVTV